MLSPAAHLQTWLNMQHEVLPLETKADALCRSLQTCSGVRRVFYLCWQPGARTYRHVGGLHLPPGQGDPLQISDHSLFMRLQQEPRLSLEQLRQEPCWLAGRLRRAGMNHGQALALELAPGSAGLLLVEVQEGERLDWLAWMHEAMLCMLHGQQAPAAPRGWLATDPQPSLLLDEQARILEANAAFLSLLGAEPLSRAGDYLPVNHLPLVRSCLAQRRAIEALEVQVGERFLLWSFIPEPGTATVLARCREASEEIRNGREAAKARRLYRLITENTTDLISRHTPDGRFLDASPASWTLLGYWPEQLRGRFLSELFHPQESQYLLGHEQEALEQDGYHTMTYRIRHQQGHYLWFETASRAIRETYTGAVVEIVSVSRDISARVQAEANKRRLEDELAHTTRLITLGELASGIAHEINQPLAAVVNYAGASQRYLQGLKDNPQAEQRIAQGLERITEHANHASQVIKRLRSFLRKGQRRMQALDVAEVAREAVRLCAWEATNCQVVIDEHLPDNLPAVYADRVLLEQVLLNLLRNAIDANKERHGGQPSTVIIAARVAEDGRLWVEVSDQGPGLSPAEQERIFTPFYTSKPEGLGLGLSMSRTIIEGFGGELDVLAAAPGQGVTLGCRLPLRKEQ